MLLFLGSARSLRTMSPPLPRPPPLRLPLYCPYPLRRPFKGVGIAARTRTAMPFPLSGSGRMAVTRPNRALLRPRRRCVLTPTRSPTTTPMSALRADALRNQTDMCPPRVRFRARRPPARPLYVRTRTRPPAR